MKKKVKKEVIHYDVSTAIKDIDILCEFAQSYGIRWHTYYQLLQIAKDCPNGFERFIELKNRKVQEYALRRKCL